MTAEIEGTIGGVSFMCFQMVPTSERQTVLAAIQAEHTRLLGIEAERAQGESK